MNHDPKQNPTAFSQGKDPRFTQAPAKETLTVPQAAQAQSLSAAEQQEKIDADAARASRNAEIVAQTKTAGERKVSVKLLNDVWIEDPGHEDAGKDGIRRVRTNIPVLDAEGNAKVDPKTKAPITTHAVVELPLSVAKMMIDSGKAERMDPL